MGRSASLRSPTTQTLALKIMIAIKTTSRFHHSKILSPTLFFLGFAVGMIGPSFHPWLLFPCIGILFYLPDISYYLQNREFTNPGLNYLFYTTKCFPKLLAVKLFMGIVAGSLSNYFMYISNKNAALNSLVIFVLAFLLLNIFTRRCIRQ